MTKYSIYNKWNDKKSEADFPGEMMIILIFSETGVPSEL